MLKNFLKNYGILTFHRWVQNWFPQLNDLIAFKFPASSTRLEMSKNQRLAFSS